MTTTSKQQRYLDEQKRLKQEQEDLQKGVKLAAEREAAKKAKYAKIAKSLTARSPLQTEITTRVTDRTTHDLVAMISYLVKNPRAQLVWVAVSHQVARDVMQRAYPLGLQRGVIARPIDKDHALRYPNGSRLEFWWPGKAPIDHIQIQERTTTSEATAQ